MEGRRKKKARQKEIRNRRSEEGAIMMQEPGSDT